MALRSTMTTYGAVRGVPCGNPTFTVYRGIPYAAPAVGENRFKAPQPPKAWEGERLCDTFRISVCRRPPSRGFPLEIFS